MLHALCLLFIEYKKWYKKLSRLYKKLILKKLLFAKRVAKHLFWPLLLRVGNLPRSTLPRQE